MLAVHATILPLHRERALVAGLVEGPDDLLEIDAAAARRTEVPAPAGIAEVDVAAEDPGAAIQGHDRVLDVDVVDAVMERADELHGTDALPVEVAGVEVEAEFLTVVDRCQGPLGRVDVERDFGRMDFERELDSGKFKTLQQATERIGRLLGESVVVQSVIYFSMKKPRE